MLTRDLLICNPKVLKNEFLHDSAVEQGKAYINAISSRGGSQIDIDVRSALEDLQDLNLITNTKVIDEQEAIDSIRQLWSDALGN